MLEKERDSLKWNQERKELENKIQQQEDIITTKDQEIKNKEDFLNKKLEQQYKDQESSYEEQIQSLRDELDAKDGEIHYVKKLKDTLLMDTLRKEELVASQFHNLGLAHFQQQRKGGRSWLENQRHKVYNHGYDYIFNPN